MVSGGDPENLLELHRLEGWPFSKSAFRRWLTRGRWSRVLVAEVDGRVVGKVTVDLAYRPYSEVVNLLVHPSLRRRGLGGALLDAAIRLAEGEGFWAQLVMTDPGNEPAARLYRSRGFLPAIVPAGGTEGYCWLIRFSEGSPPWVFQSLTPGSGFRWRGRLDRSSLYGISWEHPSGDRLDLVLRGQPGQPEWGTMPRVVGCSVRVGGAGLGCRIWEGGRYLEGGLGEFTLELWNSGPDRAVVTLSPPTGGWPAGRVRLAREARPGARPGGEADREAVPRTLVLDTHAVLRHGRRDGGDLGLLAAARALPLGVGRIREGLRPRRAARRERLICNRACKI